MIGTCKICGKEFKKRHAKRQFCSVQCRGVARRLTAQATCTNCGKVIEGRPSDINTRLARNNQHIYCSSTCANEHHRTQPNPGRYKKKPQEERTCLTCGKTFLVGGRYGRRLASKFCSRICSQTGRYEKGTVSLELTIPDAAYLAGFIDGEGTIMIITHKNGTETKSASASVQISVANSKPQSITWIMEVTGIGRLFVRPRKSDRHAPMYWWQANGDAAESILKQIRPYLKLKSAQADLALDFQERKRTPSLKADYTWQQEYRQRMKELNRRGPPVEPVEGVEFISHP